MCEFTHRIHLLSSYHSVLATKYEVVALGAESRGDAPAKQDERKHVAVLQQPILKKRIYARVGMRTLSLHDLKNSTGSCPYAAADPNHGIQWNTNGGNDRSRGSWEAWLVR